MDIDWEERRKRHEADYAFSNKVSKWLNPDNTKSPIYAHNHPSPKRDVVHYQEGRMRICCEIDEYGQEFCFLLHEFYAKNTGKAHVIKTQRFTIGSDLTEHIEQFNILIDSLPRMIPGKGFRISFIFKWYDGWLGFYWDKDKKWLYFLPIPFAGIIFKFR